MAATYPDDTLTLSEILIELHREHGAHAAISYPRLWAAVATGRVPASRLGREWRVLREHKALAAEVLGLPAASRHAAA